ncbi:MAG: lipopolysaccharide A protein [Neisseriaceae bacterium]|nr:lipopolysaccharide A protein [Neisseriaceae bacterium]
MKNYLGKLRRRFYKLQYYLSRSYLNFLPYKIIQRNMADVLSEYRSLPESVQHSIASRVGYYNQLTDKYHISGNLGFVGSFKNNRASAYFYDLAHYLRYFPEKTPFAYIFGDVTHIPSQPSLVKSRPIADNNQNSVLLKLDSVRHFYTVADPFCFADKKDLLVWRGAVHQSHRLEFLQKFYAHTLCDVKCVYQKSANQPYHGKFMSIKEQLRYKFVLSIEGNDVAINTKWIMASQSLCVMTTPKFETWFMEGLLQPDVHFVHVEDDYANLDEKLSFYLKHPAAAEKIINNANQWVSQFFNKKQELITAVLVLQKYFEHTQKIV